MFKDEGDIEGIALVMLEIGTLCGAARRWDKALPWYEQSLHAWQLFERADYGNPSGRARTLDAIGVAYRQQGQWTTHHPARQALEMYRSLGMRAGEAQALVIWPARTLARVGQTRRRSPARPRR